MPNQSSEPASHPSLIDDSALRPKLLGRLGIGLILLSGVFFFSMLSVPWWPLSVGSKTIAGGTLFVSVQAAWWIGAALVGPTALKSIKRWFVKKNPHSDEDPLT